MFKKNAISFLSKLKSISSKILSDKLKIPKNHIEDAFRESCPNLYYPNPNWNEFINLLKYLEKNNKLILPKGLMHWDHTRNPFLPKWIKLKAQSKKPSFTIWKTYPWKPSLLPVLEFKAMKKASFESLKKVNEFCGTLTIQMIALPIKERSLQIFGDEKKLDQLINRYSKMLDLLKILNCYHTFEPILGESFISSSKKVIVIENRDTYFSFCKANKLATPPIYSKIFYGMGKVFVNSVHSLINELEETTVVNYFGDIDKSGFEIPYQASKFLNKNNIELKLSEVYYSCLIKKHKKCKLKCNDKPNDIKQTSLFLDLPKADQKYIVNILKSGARIPQELLNISDIIAILKNGEKIELVSFVITRLSDHLQIVKTEKR